VRHAGAVSSHGATEHHPGPGWPFWAPTEGEAIDRALTLAGVGSGDRFVDLGCGDGRVLVAAARRGAQVTGIESDAALVSEAKETLAEAGVDGTVLQEDIFGHPLDADVVFAYLSPATLQRLLPHFATLDPGARLVTIDFAVPGLIPQEEDGPARVYRTPLESVRQRRHIGWSAAGALVVALPDYESLTCLELVHPGGPVELSVTGDVTDIATFRAGLGRAESGDIVAVDIRWGEEEAGVVASGVVSITGLPEFPVFVLFSDDDIGMWELSDDGCTRLAEAFRRGVIPGTPEGLVAVALGQP
jgi:SAM-dependent methyltransferase